jgi:hypothetical protein
MSEYDDLDAIRELDALLDELAAGSQPPTGKLAGLAALGTGNGTVDHDTLAQGTPPHGPTGTPEHGDAAADTAPIDATQGDTTQIDATPPASAAADTAPLDATSTDTTTAGSAAGDTVPINASTWDTAPIGRAANGTGSGGLSEADLLAALALDLRAAVPGPTPEAAARGRAALLAKAGGRRRWPLPLKRAALLAAALMLVAIPAVGAPQSVPGSAFYPLREAGQEVRAVFAPGAVARANKRFDDAAGLLDKAAERARDHADDPPEKLREDLGKLAGKAKEDALDGMAALGDATGAEADAARARGQRLLAEADKVLAGGTPSPTVPGGGGEGGADEPEDLGDDHGRGGDEPEDGDDDLDKPDDDQGRGRGRGRSGSG